MNANYHSVAFVPLAILGSLIAITGIVLMECDDVHKLNTFFKQDIRGAENKKCLNYLQMYASRPVWRKSFIFSLVLTVVSLGILFILGMGTKTDFKTLSIFALLQFVALWFVGNSVESFNNWHVLCHNSCAVASFNDSKINKVMGVDGSQYMIVGIMVLIASGILFLFLSQRK